MELHSYVLYIPSAKLSSEFSKASKIMLNCEFTNVYIESRVANCRVAI